MEKTVWDDKVLISNSPWETGLLQEKRKTSHFILYASWMLDRFVTMTLFYDFKKIKIFTNTIKIYVLVEEIILEEDYPTRGLSSEF